MERSDLVNLWVKHCAEARHVTQADAMDLNLKPSKKHATYSLALTGNRITCNAPKCQWSFPA
jgi:hypothetical protein